MALVAAKEFAGETVPGAGVALQPLAALWGIWGVMRHRFKWVQDQPGVVEEDCFEEQEFSMRLINSIHAYRTLRTQTHWSSGPDDDGCCASDGREEGLGVSVVTGLGAPFVNMT